MAEKLKVLFVASEGVPFAKTGGLADVVGTLPYALQELGVEVKVLLPYYGAVKQGKIPTAPVAENLEVSLLEPLNLSLRPDGPHRPGISLLVRGPGRILRAQPALRHPQGRLFRQPGALRLFQRRGAARLPGHGFQAGPDPLPRLAELPGAGLFKEPLGPGKS